MNEELTELLEELDLQGYLDYEGVDYKEVSGSRGAQLNLRTCPVCQQDKWKVYLNADTGLGNCFSGSCEAKFNKWSFIKAQHGVDDTRAVIRHIKDVLHRVGWRPKRKHTAGVDTSTLRLPDSIPLPIEGQNLVYLEDRGISVEIAKFFHLAYCAIGKHRFTRTDGNPGWQDFAGRIIIPVFDLTGALVTFQGRDITGTAERKYLFPSGLPATGRYLYNGQNVMRAKRAVMGEGAFDVMALKIAMDSDPALRDVAPIGSFGKHMSDGDGDQISQFRILRRQGLEELTICWDGEVEALNAALRAGALIQTTGIRTRIMLMPKGKDPNETSVMETVRAYYMALPLTPATHVRLQMSNPYR